MSDAQIDEALEAVITAARRHRAVLASPAAPASEIWAAYAALNNASVHYDDLISQAYDEVTPWDCEYIDEGDSDEPSPLLHVETSTPVHVCVRHRRDYVVADPQAVLDAANTARARMTGGPENQITHLGQAVYALIDAGDGTIAALDDIDDLEPGNGVLLVNELDKQAEPSSRFDAEVLFALPRTNRLLYRLDEVMVGEE